MDKTALVITDFAKGEELLKALDLEGLPVNVALWAYLPEYEGWRLILAAPRFDELGIKKAHRLLRDTLNHADVPVERTPVFMILPMSDPTIRSLRRMFGKTKHTEGMRLGGQTIGDRFIEDAYSYRIT